MASVDGVRRGAAPARVAACGVLLALSFLAGEPVAAAGTTALALGYAAFGGADTKGADGHWRRAAGGVLAASGLGLALAAVQVIPLWDASRRSIRGAGLLQDTWALHPLRLLEFLLPGVFGDYFGPAREISPWLWPLNSGREPYLFSLYVGPAVILLAWRALATGHHRASLFWAASGGIALVCALGEHAGLYPWLRSTFSPLRALRYPEKYVVFAAFALAVLAAAGWQELSRSSSRQRTRDALAALPAALLIGAVLWALVAPELPLRLATRTAASLGLQPADVAAARLTRDLGAKLPRLLGLLAATAALAHVAASGRTIARVARHGLLVLVAADLLASGAHLNPTVDASRTGPPSWLPATREHPEARAFIAQDLLGDAAPDPDAPPPLAREALPLPHALAAYTAELPPFPTVWGVREALAADLTGLRPREYLTLLERYDASDRAGRTRLLQRMGTRYFVLPRPPSSEARRLQDIPHLAPLALYDDPPAAPRVSVVPAAQPETDVAAQIAGFADASSDPAAHLLVSHEPEPAGHPGSAPRDEAIITAEAPLRVAIRARISRGGTYLRLLDAYDPHWTVEVDGEPAEMLRADGVFRAVRLEAGQHDVVFAYRPAPWRRSAAISASAALLLMVTLVAARRRVPAAPSARPPQG
jgi:hypothetical protein